MKAYRFSCVFLFGLAIQAGALAQQDAVQIPVPEVWQHRTSTSKSIHTDRFQTFRFGQDYVTLDVIVGVDGKVESAKAVEGPQDFYAQAETLERDAEFKPFVKDGVPVRAKLKDYVRLAPPEQWLPEHAPFPAVKDFASLRMKLTRTACFGMCPDYSVEIQGNGQVNYRGNAFVLITGEHHSQLPRKSVEQLLAKFRDADYFSLNDQYVAGITDNPTFTTSIEFDGIRKTVKDYVGHYVGMPDVVGDLETEIDRIAGTQKWIKETPETLPALRAEHWDFKANTEENAALFANVIAQGSPELVAQFMKGGAPALTIAKSRLGTRSALESAALKGNLDLVRQMLKGQDNLPEAVLFQALRAGAQSGNLDLVRFLIEQGADVNGKPADPQDQQTVLMSAVQSGKPEVVKEVLLHNPDVNAKYYSGFTALTMFLQNGGNQPGADDILKTLLAHASNLSLRDEQGTTPIFHACMMPSAVKILVDAGADPNARDNSGQTALLRCVFNKNFVAAMLEAGADPSIADRDGRTPLDAARSMSSKDSAALLEAALKRKATP